MMQPFKSILVDVDATATAHPALERAIRLAQSTGATVTIVDVMNLSHLGSYLPSGLEEDIVRNQRQQLTLLERRP
jgi:nucleotide-binding universal stress UspA family protein